ncbi:MAG TPA: hypothetical protein VFN20_11665 [Candidatus Acidoferrum sp.]|nr:hypothetical protein [Candidatus Acidoferrum sp.]
MNCPICEKRKAARYCPAKGEKICAVCCGTEREVTISCPPDCAYLVAAHRYEDEHKRALPEDTPFLDERIPQDILHTHQQLMTAVAFQTAKFASNEPATADPDVTASLAALAGTYKTLQSGLLYEKVPDIPVERDLYLTLSQFLTEIKQKAAESGNSAALKDTAIFQVIVFLYRMGLLRSNGRPRSRRFIEFLRGQFPQAPDLKREEPRIIVP